MIIIMTELKLSEEDLRAVVEYINLLKEIDDSNAKD